jgi:hypothetical protein
MAMAERTSESVVITEPKLPKWLTDYQKAYPVREPNVADQLKELRGEIKRLDREIASLKSNKS